MKLYYDFHIHSGLSPCSSEDMSPNNIVNMSVIKGLDAIAVTDHNGIGNVRACVEIGKTLPIIVIPGMEIQTVEDFHSIILFKTVEDLETFYANVDEKRLKIPNKPERFGHQYIYSVDDEVIDEEMNYLITPFNITFDKVIELVNDLGGVAFPAHINRNSFSIFNSLGFIDKSLDIENIEWYKEKPDDYETFENKMFKSYRELFNSDAHQLVDISEQINYIDVDEISIEGIFRTLKRDVKE